MVEGRQYPDTGSFSKQPTKSKFPRGGVRGSHHSHTLGSSCQGLRKYKQMHSHALTPCPSVRISVGIHTPQMFLMSRQGKIHKPGNVLPSDPLSFTSGAGEP